LEQIGCDIRWLGNEFYQMLRDGEWEGLFPEQILEFEQSVVSTPTSGLIKTIIVHVWNIKNDGNRTG